MTKEIIRCDRCNNIANDSFFDLRLSVKFREQASSYDTVHDLCYDCWKELRDWFFKKENLEKGNVNNI